MSPILGIWASSIQPSLNASSFESIATVTVGAGGAASIDLTSIPATYTHLQIRGIAKGAQTTYAADNFLFKVNNDSGSNYANHILKGDGSSATALANASSTTGIVSHNGLVGGSASNVFTTFVMDILDYANTSKYKTIRTLTGFDANGSGVVELTSTLWQSTSAVNRLTFTEETGGNMAQYSTIAIYGIKGA